MNPVQASLISASASVPLIPDLARTAGKAAGKLGRTKERGGRWGRGAFLLWQQMTNQLFWFYK